MPKLSLPLRDIQNDEPAARCEKCLGEVYAEETMFEWDGRDICVDCFKENVRLWLELSPQQVAGALDFPFHPAAERRGPL